MHVEIMKNTNAQVHFAIRGEFDPDALTDLIGLPPTSISKKGNPVLPGSAIGPKSDAWHISSDRIETLDVSQGISDHLDALDNYSERIFKHAK